MLFPVFVVSIVFDDTGPAQVSKRDNRGDGQRFSFVRASCVWGQSLTFPLKMKKRKKPFEPAFAIVEERF
jgi:hypothetical protein